mmetsp:Transcript_11507/g.29125  ORF Transcript_11507/g.29125 Transcript_11507/m.29125 type:complete len:509 (-) Transcript_11507:161-1687(-)
MLDHLDSFSEGRKPGNLALCQTTDEIAGPECLNFQGLGEVGFQIRSTEDLNWRFEDGLLRAVNTNGHATDQCLGPNQEVTNPDPQSDTPYELILQDCPARLQSDTANIFSHNDGVTPRMEDEVIESIEEAFHMRYLIVGDGRIQSLAPVKDGKAFCVTAMKWGDVVYTNAVLAPCVDAASDLGGSIQREQQFFDMNAGSSFDPFLFSRKGEEKSTVEFAYQIGKVGPLATGIPERYDSYVIKVVTEEDLTLLSETTVAEGVNATSGLVLLSDFGASGKMEAHLIGVSKGGLVSSWLASTSFEVGDKNLEEASGHRYTNSWTWALVTFLGFMTFYVCLVKCNSIFCPSKPALRRKEIKKVRKEIKLEKEAIKRDSEHTTRTADISVTQATDRAREEAVLAEWGRDSGRSSNGRSSIESWGRTSGRSSIDSQQSILFRISEERFDLLDMEQTSSEDHTFANVSSFANASSRSADTNASSRSRPTDSDGDLDSAAGVTDEDKDIDIESVES